jgi:phage repressor protein C with HTH and peptisase S24 domain
MRTKHCGRSARLSSRAGDNFARTVWIVAGIGERLSDARGRLSRDEAAGRLGIHPTTLRRYEMGQRPPDSETLTRACEVYGVTEAWLLNGRGPREAPTRMAESGPVFRPAESADAVSIPLFDIQASAGGGQLVWDEQPTTRVVFPRVMLQRMGINPRGAKLLLAKGDSMEPTIGDGNLMLVDIADIDLRDDIFVLRREESVLVKRLQRHLDGSLAVRSDNPAYQEDRLPRDEAEDLQIIGRVRMVFKAV